MIGTLLRFKNPSANPMMLPVWANLPCQAFAVANCSPGTMSMSRFRRDDCSLSLSNFISPSLGESLPVESKVETVEGEYSNSNGSILDLFI
jgi:hypothetical protein